ncbi:unnamed protein product [Caenorhabditis auriculariae]|uniref:AP3A hydrolase n=1 Tax=Caenorhabditis auriculariae TaxID=2777116 RepID=A0A8S1H845_9PELO|nr:unnamed protein product [Caenorhabditis auriculariae]
MRARSSVSMFHWQELLLLCALSPHPRLLLISFDGFRHDLLNKTFVPNIAAWASRGTWFTSGVKSQYITFTVPNHMSMATGRYEENHGIVSNFFYDTGSNKFFDYFNYTKVDSAKESRSEFWYSADPIWLTNERASSTRFSSVFYWPAGDSSFPLPPHKPTFSKSWKERGVLKDWMRDCDDVLEQLTREEKPSNFVIWYIAEPDSTLHMNGFFNGELKKVLKHLDEVFRYFLKRLEDLDLEDKVNVILTADHGHAEIKDEKHVMCLRDFIHGDDFVLTDHMIYPKNSQHAQELVKNLTDAVEKHDFKVNIHWKENFPAMYHYKNTSRVGQIILEPQIGSSISFSCSAATLESTYGINGTVRFNSSTHGMDPDRPEMRAILAMNGPLFASKIAIDEIPENIDLYLLMCNVLNITPSLNDGSFEIIGKALRAYDRSNVRHGTGYLMVTDTMGFLFVLAPSMCIVILFLVYGCRRTVLKGDISWGRTDAVQGYRPLQNESAADFDVEESRAPSNNRFSNLGQINSGAVSMSGLLDEMSDDEL